MSDGLALETLESPETSEWIQQVVASSTHKQKFKKTQQNQQLKKKEVSNCKGREKCYST